LSAADLPVVACFARLFYINFVLKLFVSMLTYYFASLHALMQDYEL